MAPATTTSVQVALRIRPITPQDSVSIPARFQRTVIHATSDTSVSVDAVASTPTGTGSNATVAAPVAANKKQAFTFDLVHNTETTQYQMYTSTAEPLIARFIEGFNCTILAYGQTSSGKTHTMTGHDLEADPSNPDNGMGIIPRSIAEIFSRVNEEKREKRGAWNATVKGSFIEIYNEDLIDLLSSEDPKARREVQIREDKDGHIIWGGLREVPVRNVSEVMNLIRQGTSIRRTNETQMNAQSSRSHAIFSLTLTQKRFTGSGLPPRSSTPLPNPSSPSRIGRPGSVYTNSTSTNRVGSPTFGRPPTPSFHSAINRSQQHLRPHSSLGHSEDDRLASNPQRSGEWTTIVSKFHFVDLAGSERLKRTAAAGERIKEGISINSGLLALGNVISALGDPSKTKVTTHIPYRDSKLTRLLQDSLGGNAHTLMIACVSPVEWNVGETVNTLKYANRARNIRNRVRIDEREEGWDDIEWLQATVTRLRRDLKSIRESGVILPSDSAVSHPSEDEGMSNPAKQVREQLADLQTQYVELRQRFTDRTEELTRLRREAGESMRKSGGSMGAGTGRYEEIVGPVIEEYEKTISSMEAELSLNRAALRHTNDLLTEKEEEISAEVERHAVTEAYLEELRTRVSKLSERESSTEAYIQDLEEKIKGFSSSSLTHSESLSFLQKELTRHKESETTNASYIADLEARLGKADESVIELRNAVTQAENLSEQRSVEIKALEETLSRMRDDEQGWRSDLEAREEKVRDLEKRMKEWELKKEEAATQREKLGNLVLGVEGAKRSLDDISKSTTPLDESPPLSLPINGETGLEARLQIQLQDLQQTHAATLADLSNITDKYRDSLREISDLASQLQEVRLQLPSHSSSTSISDSGEVSVGSVVTRRRKPSVSRKTSLDSNAEPVSPGSHSAGRRGFFRQATSTESLRTRSLSQSLSLSQELSSARLPQRLMPSPALRHQRSESLLSSIHSSRPHLSLALPSTNGSLSQSDRSVLSLEQEIMRLQEVLKERESEIRELETALQHNGNEVQPGYGEAHKLSPQTLDNFQALRTSIIHELPDTETEFAVEKRASVGRLDELMRSMAQKESRHREVVDELTSQLKHIQRQRDELTALSRDQALNMSNELGSLRKAHEETLSELNLLKDKDSQLTNKLGAIEDLHAEEIKELYRQHSKELAGREVEIARLTAIVEQGDPPGDIAQLKDQLSETKVALAEGLAEHELSLSRMTANHDQELQLSSHKNQSETEHLKALHAQEIAKLQEKTITDIRLAKEEAAQTLNRNDEEYYTALSNFRAQHEEELRRKDEESTRALERLRADFEAQLRQAEIARQGALEESHASQSDAFQQLQAEHDAALNRKHEEFSTDLQLAEEAHARAIQGKELETNQKLARLRNDHASALARLNEELSKEVRQLEERLVAEQRDHAELIAALENKIAAKLEKMEQDKAYALNELQQIHNHALDQFQGEQQTLSKKVADAHDASVRDMQRRFTEEKAEYQQKIIDLETSLTKKTAEHEIGLQELREQHQKAFDMQQEEYERSMDLLKAEQDTEKATWRSHQEQMLREADSLKASHQEALAKYEATVTTQEATLNKMTLSIHSLEKELTSIESQHADSVARYNTIQAEHDRLVQKHAEESARHQSLAEDVTAHRSELDIVKSELEKTKELNDNLFVDKNRLEGTVRELQTQLSNLPANTLNPPFHDIANSRPLIERTISYPRTNGLPPAKLPPLSPPPSIPPPPLPTTTMPSSITGEGAHSSFSSISTHARQSSGSQETHETVPTPSTSVNGGSNGDEVLLSKVQSQTRLMEEQEAMIKTLNKQLAHCEGDLQAHVDLVSTLESSLSDSERNLRKARNQANELTRERDLLTKQLDATRTEVREAQRELADARQSVIEQKHSLEQRLDEERKAKERTRAQLDARLDEMQRRKSKFACL